MIIIVTRVFNQRAMCLTLQVNILGKQDPEIHYAAELLIFLESLLQTPSMANMKSKYVVKS